MISYLMENGKPVYQDGTFTLIKGAECLKQRLTGKLRLDYGSWYFAPDEGFPWFEVYQKKEISARMVKAYLSNIITADEEVTDLESIEVTLDRETRLLSSTVKINSEYDPVEVTV